MLHLDAPDLACIELLRVAAGRDIEGEVPLFGEEENTSLEPESCLIGNCPRSEGSVERVSVLPLDAVLAAGSLLPVDVLKIDTEGWDWRVLQGLERTLSRGAVGMCIFEYGTLWNSEFMYQLDDLPPLNWTTSDELTGASLHKVVTSLYRRGYNVYLLGLPFALPLAEAPGGLEHWHEAYEVCANTRTVPFNSMMGSRCWFDILAVRADHPLAIPVAGLVPRHLLGQAAQAAGSTAGTPPPIGEELRVQDPMGSGPQRSLWNLTFKRLRRLHQSYLGQRSSDARGV